MAISWIFFKNDQIEDIALMMKISAYLQIETKV
jgi:hypothetical protein